MQAPAAMAQTARIYTCQCGQAIFFVNSRCLACDTLLGYDTAEGRLMPLAPGAEPDTWVESDTTAPAFLFCGNRDSPANCNWLLPEA